MGRDDIPLATYLNSCPNCGGDITTLKLLAGSACDRCVPEERTFNSIQDLILFLDSTHKLDRLNNVRQLLGDLEKVSNLFVKILGSPPLGPQRSWIIRALRGESFAVVAPPGLGKTTFGTIMSLFYYMKGKKSLMIFPTKTLVTQVAQRLTSMSKNLGSTSPKLAYYYSGLTSSQKQEFITSLESEDFDVLISTSRYIMKNIGNIEKYNYNYLFVDDVDSVLKSSKSANVILRLVGFTDNDVISVKELLKESRNNYEEAYEKISKIKEKKIKDKIAIFSSATITKGNPVFSSLMGFKPGSAVIYLRNVIDSYVQSDQDQISLINSLVQKLGSGGIIYVPVDKGIKYAKELASNIHQIKSAVITSNSTSKLEKFESGEIDVLIGTATHYGILVRGIDLPWRVRYAIFAGIPKFQFKIGETMHPLAMLKMLTLISLVSRNQDVTRILRIVRGRLRNISTMSLALLAKDIKEEKINDKYIEEAYKIVNKYLSDNSMLEKISEIGEMSINNGYVSVPDYLTYIQASGRTSRIFGGELTTGLSVVLVDNLKLFDLLKRRLSLVLEDVSWNNLDLNSWKVGDRNLDDILNKIDSERENISKIKKEGFLESAPMKKIKTILFVVESPNKAKTISNFFSKPSVRDFNGLRVYETVIGDKVLMVTASGGHIYDLTTKNLGIHGIEIEQNSELTFIPYYNTIKRCAKGHQFTEANDGKCPTCGSLVVRDKRDTVNLLSQLAIEADEILVGTDPDVEGEKIAWDIYFSLRPFNKEIKRAEFHEVTRKAIVEAINNSRSFSAPMLRSQIVRRIEDRWIGFSLSIKLQKNFWPEYCSNIVLSQTCNDNRNLSAGRVQT
ncbi:reverse gyrase, partial [Acidianus sp. RZ1]|uniref:reverse gyrase n=1 Tax=Acidianus sp. RZ1 TaxID=1540082 RepID=UPI0014919982